MPNYEYDKDYPFAAFITNLGKYNEGELVGKWVRFPTTAEEMKKAFDRIGIGQKDDFGNPYEEWFISDYDCYVDGIYDKLGEYESLDELNYLASKLDEMSQSEYEQFQAAMELGDHTGSVQEIINLTENLDCYDVYPDIHDHDDLGRYYIEKLDAMEVPEYLRNYIDYEAYGRDIAIEENGSFTDLGYVRDTGSSFHEYYDGDRESIPEEYQVMTFQEGAPEYDDFLDVDPVAVRAALENPDKSRVDEMLAFAEQAEREYAAQADAYVQTPADIVEQARAIQEGQAQENTFSIYQLKGGDQTLDYRFEPLDAIRRNGLSVKPENYELVYTTPLTEGDNLESIFTRFNVDRPADFTGHSLSVSDIVVLHENGKDTAHYCDRVGFSQVPGFLTPEWVKDSIAALPEVMATQEWIHTPRGTFCVTDVTREQMEAAGYGFHHQSEDGKYLIMGNGTTAYAIPAEQPEKENPLRTAEMTIEDDYGMIDGVINNGRRGEELEKAAEKKPSIRERLEDAKRECAERKPPEKGRPDRKAPEHGEL